MTRNPELQSHTEAIGRKLLARARGAAREGHAAEQWLSGFIARLAGDGTFRVQALRFIDVLPTLSDDKALARHLHEYFSGGDFPLPRPVKWGVKHAGDGPAPHVISPVVRKAVKWIGGRFIAGHNPDEAFKVIERLHGEGKRTSLDMLGEEVLSEEEAEAYQRQYLDLIDSLAPRLAKHGQRLHLSIKVSSLYSQMTPAAPAHGAATVKNRLRPILTALRKHGGGITLDMEHYDIKGVTLRVFTEIMTEPAFTDWPDCGIALQAYLKETEDDLTSLIDWAKRRGAPAHVRLVRGAYWDMESVIAQREGWEAPVWEGKGRTDASFERCLALLMRHHSYIRPAIASHNVRSLALAIALAEKHGLAPADYEFQMLYGMAERLQDTLIGMGQPLRIYVPAGPIIPGMAYLVRRLLENSTAASFLRMAFMEDADARTLLSPPPADNAPTPESAENAFAIEPTHRFTGPVERKTFDAAIETVRGQLGGQHPLIIGGRPVETQASVTSVNPAQPNQVVGLVSAGAMQDADAAIKAAARALPQWAGASTEERTGILRRAAAMLRDRRDEFAAWEIFEAGKPWREADADVAEAIDYLEYYAGEAQRLFAGQRFDVSGETNAYGYQPRGVAVIIPPWNFPLAIACGMLSAAIACGNTAILKPSSQTPVIAARFVSLLTEAGMPDGVVNFLPADGASIGEYLVAHPGVHIIAFTGSRKVGCRIQQIAARCLDTQDHVKRVIAEMGGKNAIIVDSDADLDDAVAGIISSAFGYAGQKCSACSRVIAVGGIYDELMERLAQASESLIAGPPEKPETFLGPVISNAAKQRIQAAIEHGGESATLTLHTNVAGLGEGYYVGPAIFTGVSPDDALAQEEIFGPVLAVLRADGIGQAITIANGTRYALTGGVYSRSPANVQRVQQRLNVGNLYINRRITGAIVGRQPFGGFRMSGTGHKAGGPDYLLRFVQAKTITENTLRRGFAPG
ncbi:MAG: proline dehydrogenase family protein [Mariprofundaceae bacterium]